jgi:short-subunit dehydrogenase
MELKGAHVLVTGGSRGIGAALAREFAKAGAQVSLTARSTQAIEALATEIGGQAFTADLLDPASVDSLIDQVESAAGPIDVLVNNAGLEDHGWFHESDVAESRRVIHLNLEAPIVLTRNVLPGMIERGSGHLVFISSLAGTGGFPGTSVYGATKAGLTNFVAALRMELAGTGINSTVVAPGPVDTDMWDAIEQDNELEPMLRRMRMLRILPTKSPEMLAKRSIAAVRADRRHVRVPRRLASNHWLREVPTRLNELLLTGVPVGIGATKAMEEQAQE